MEASYTPQLGDGSPLHHLFPHKEPRSPVSSPRVRGFFFGARELVDCASGFGRRLLASVSTFAPDPLEY